LISVVGLLPSLVLGVPAGVLVERVRRRPMMIAMDLTRAVAWRLFR
jgi:ABC-type proline/glycine betaine transport system permease subunit